MALDEFPQMEKPFLGDRIKMEKKWVAEGKKTLLQMQREADPSVGDGPGPALRWNRARSAARTLRGSAK